MTEDDRSAIRAADSDREKVARLLYDAMSTGRITTEELENRLGKVYAARTIAEFEPLLADLPAGGREEHGPRKSVAVMSGLSRKDDWVLPPKHSSLAFWGGADLDLRRARLTAGHSTISAVAIMGGIKIVVPDDVTVEVDGTGLMGGFRLARGSGLPRPPVTAPTVRVTGLAFWGSVKVVRKPRNPSGKRRRRSRQ
ncbi:DUF1707 SHOCT-like domain-containing protein [Amycolatopsis anabasis]|uniref:DUF1707 SHOCT-like domain-containing protein n=1 Tax=Amycolatopsis anabasis TaxID=1840409 RepID=UPI00131A7A84|nr:DUF1707 domain-containing protein [Amycolatopsis anabasis]